MGQSHHHPAPETRRVLKYVGTDNWIAASGRDEFDGIHETFTISKLEEAGDGTVPLRSGIAAKPRSQSFLEVAVEHEPAFDVQDSKDSLRAARFTLRAIVKIAQGVQQTSLRYQD